MPLDHTLEARDLTVGDSAVDVGREVVAVASIEPAGPAGSEEVASIVHAVELRYLEAWVEEEASAARQVLAWVQWAAAEVVNIPVAPFVYLVLGNDLAPPLLQV